MEGGGGEEGVGFVEDDGVKTDEAEGIRLAW